MRRLSLYFFAFIIVCAQAQTPATLSYQGLLTNASGIPVADGNHTVLFKFYTTPTGGSSAFTRGTLSVNTFKGLFTTILGNGQGSNNDPLPYTLGDTQYYIGIEVDGGVELSPRISLTAVPYAFVANTVKTLDASIISSGTMPDARLSTHLQDLADGTLSGSKVGTGINASNITSGTLAITQIGDGTVTNVKLATDIDAAKVTTGTFADARLSAHLQDLADGTLTGSKVGTGINASNITSGTLAIAQIGDGTLTNAKLATDIDATKITAGTLTDTRLSAHLQDLADGSLSGSKIGTGINANNITTGTLSAVNIALTATSASKLASGTTAERPGVPVEGQIRYNSTEKTMEYFNGTGWYFLIPKVAFLKDTKNNGTQAGTATNGSFRTRELNTLEGDVSFVSLSANQFTLTPGEYIIEASSPMVAVSRYKIILWNITSGELAINGTGGFLHPSNNDVAGRGDLMGKVTIVTSSIFEVQYYCSTSYSSWGLGSSGSSGVAEVYTQVKITKLK